MAKELPENKNLKKRKLRAGRFAEIDKQIFRLSNASTAEQYTDLMLRTAAPAIGHDAAKPAARFFPLFEPYRLRNAAKYAKLIEYINF